MAISSKTKRTHHNVTALAQTYGSHQSVVAPAAPVVAPLGEPPSTTPFNPLVQQQKQGRPKATTTAKMMPCIFRHHGNFFQNDTASPQRHGLATTSRPRQNIRFLPTRSGSSRNRSGSLRGASGHNAIQYIGVTTKQGRPKATATAKMMPCISRHHGNFFQNEMASPQRHSSRPNIRLPPIRSSSCRNRRGSLKGASQPNSIQYVGVAIKQGRPKATTTAKMMPCIYRHHGNFFQNETASPQRHSSRPNIRLPPIRRGSSRNRRGSLKGASRHNTIQSIGVTTKQGRPKATLRQK